MTPLEYLEVERRDVTAPGHCPKCGALMHLEMGTLRCRDCDSIPPPVTVPDSEEGGPAGG